MTLPVVDLGTAPDDLASASAAAAERAMELGIVRARHELPPDGWLPGLSVWVASGQHMPRWNLTAPLLGVGMSPDRAVAGVIAVAEAVEAYCTSAPPKAETLVRASFGAVRDQAVRADLLSLNAPLAESTVIEWCSALSLNTRREILVPADLVYRYRLTIGEGRLLPELSSTGVAAHVSSAKAILNGLMEVFERDALALWWHAHVPAIPLEVEESTELARWRSRARADWDLDFSFFQLVSDAPFPVVLAVATRSHSQPHLVVGAACRASASEAATKALFEAAYVGRMLTLLPKDGGELESGLLQHAMRYASLEGADLVRGRLATSRQRLVLTEVRSAGTGRVEPDLVIAVDALDGRKEQIIVADLTTDEARRAGFVVVRVLVPGAADPISSEPRFLRLGARRLREVPVRLGCRHRPLERSELDPLPAPLA